MKTIGGIFISIAIFATCLYALSNIGTEMYINNGGNFSANDVEKLSRLSVEVGYVEQNLSSFQSGTTEFQQTDVSNVKEYIAEFLDARTTVQQFVDFIKQAYRGGDIILMALPYAVYETLGDFVLNLYRAFFIMLVTLAIYKGLKTGEVLEG